MARVEYDPHTALVVVDAQNDLAHPKGSLCVEGGEDVEPTQLAGLLRSRGVTHLMVCGLAADSLVNSTAMDGLSEGFKVRVLWSAIRAVNPKQGNGDLAIAADGAEIVRVGEA